jgi:Nif-specific regulatory protein
LWNGSREHTTLNFTPLPIVSAIKPAPRAPAPRNDEAAARSASLPAGCPGAENCTVAEADHRTDQEKLVDAMEQAGWVKAKAARLLGLTPRQIGYALQKYNIPVKKF